MIRSSSSSISIRNVFTLYSIFKCVLFSLLQCCHRLAPPTAAATLIYGVALTRWRRLQQRLQRRPVTSNLTWNWQRCSSNSNNSNTLECDHPPRCHPSFPFCRTFTIKHTQTHTHTQRTTTSTHIRNKSTHSLVKKKKT